MSASSSKEALVQKLRQAQEELKKWIAENNLSGVQFIVGDRDELGFRYGVLDIHGPCEAYIFWAEGTHMRYTFEASVWEGDFGSKASYGSRRILAVCEGVTKLDAKQVAKEARRVTPQTCFHNRLQS